MRQRSTEAWVPRSGTNCRSVTEALSPRDRLRKVIARTSRVIHLRNLELIACLGMCSQRIFAPEPTTSASHS
jgi:hypothetical protein